MVAMKRPASASAARAAKRPTKAKARAAGYDLEGKCDTVADVLLNAGTFPWPVLEMLSSNVADSLGVAKEKRHPFQEKVVAMMGEVVDSVVAAAQARVEEAEAKVSEVTATKDQRESEEKAADENLSAKEEATANATTASMETALALSTAETELVAARAALDERKAGTEADEKKKVELTAVMRSHYLPLKEGAADPPTAKGLLGAVMDFGKEYALDKTLLSTLPTALSKAPAKRGTFDKLVLEQVSEMFDRAIADLETNIANSVPGIKECEAKVEECVDAVNKAKAADEESKAALDACKAAQKEAHAAKQAASKTLKQSGPEMKDAAAALADASATLATIREGPLEAYKALLERSDALPEEPQEPAAEGAAAPDEAAVEEEVPVA